MLTHPLTRSRRFFYGLAPGYHILTAIAFGLILWAYLLLPLGRLVSHLFRLLFS